MSRQQRAAEAAVAPLRRAVILTAILAIVAIAVAAGALVVTLSRGTTTAPASPTDETACRTVSWGALPDAASLPSGWAAASTRFLIGFMTTTLVGPTPSGSTQGPAALVSVTCYGTDAALALTRDHAAALAGGATDVSFPSLGEQSMAVTSTRTSSTTVYIRRGVLVADITSATSLDQTTLLAVAEAVDGAMTRALSATPPPSGASPAATSSPSAAASVAPSPSPSPSPSPTASPSPTPVSHVAPDLEALLPKAVSGTALTSESVTGSGALGTDLTSQSLLASLGNLGKTAADLQIAEAHDPAGTLQLRVFAFRVQGRDRRRPRLGDRRELDGQRDADPHAVGRVDRGPLHDEGRLRPGRG